MPFQHTSFTRGVFFVIQHFDMKNNFDDENRSLNVFCHFVSGERYAGCDSSHNEHKKIVMCDEN